MTPNSKGSKLIVLFMLFCMFLLAGVTSAWATHFRFGQITYQVDSQTTTQAQVTFTITSAWRQSFPTFHQPPNSGNLPVVGDSFTVGSFQFGDGQNANYGGTVTAVLSDLNGENYVVMQDTLTHTYNLTNGAGNFLASIRNCCRISTLQLGHSDNVFHVETRVVIAADASVTGSSVSSITPILQAPLDVPFEVELPIANPDGTNVTCSSENTQANGLPNPMPAYTNFVVTSDCKLQMNFQSPNVQDKFKYAIQVRMDAPTGQSTDLDFIIEVNGNLVLNDPPTCTLNGAVNSAIGVGQPFSISATGNDNEDTQLQMSAIGVPPGATLTPPSGTTANDPFNVTFNWTPTIVGSFATTIVYTDSQNAQGACNFSVNVVSAPPIADAGADQGVDEDDPVTLDGSSSSDPFNRPLTFQWTQIAGPAAVGFAGGNTANPTFTAPSVLSDTILTFQLEVDNGAVTDNSAIDTVDILVRNTNSPPTADAGPDQTVEATGALTAVTLDGSGSSDPDNDPLNYSWSGDASGSGVGLVINLSVGVHTITLLVDDGNGETDTDTVTITVQDTTPPVITAPADVTACNDPNQSTAVVSFPDPTASDNGGFVTVTRISGLATGSAFPIGATIVTWTATDAAGNTASASMTVTVNDCEAPVVTTSDLTVEATGPTTPVDIAAVTSATDNVAVTSGPTADNNGPFPVGTTTVTWTACDAAGNCGNATQTVTVTDTTPPVITAAADVTACNDPNAASAVVAFAAPTASDNSGTVNVNQTSGLPSGSAYPVGTTVNSWTATDAAGNTASASMTVIVNDCEAPVVTTSDLTVEATGPTTAVDILAATSAVDNVGVTSGPTEDNNGPFPVGSTTVNWQACDAAGNCGTAIQTVTVVDSTPPVIDNTCLQDNLWPPNHKMVLSVEGMVSDAVGATVNIDVTSNQPIDGPGDGHTRPDWETAINPDGSYSVLLRAERSGHKSHKKHKHGKNQRDYTVTVTATDDAGNVATATCIVSVKHDKGKHHDHHAKLKKKLKKIKKYIKKHHDHKEQVSSKYKKHSHGKNDHGKQSKYKNHKKSQKQKKYSKYDQHKQQKYEKYSKYQKDKYKK